ncbi:MAG: hypothetical protein ACFBRM_15160 [Pikeienuella sp.]
MGARTAVVLAVAFSLQAGSGADAQKPELPALCRIEPNEAGRAVCVANVAETLALAIEAEIDRFAGTVQVANGTEAALRLERLRRGATALRIEMRTACPDRDLAGALCRLAAAEGGAALLAQSLADLRERLGLSDPYAGYAPRLEVTPGPRGGFFVTPQIDLPAP